MQSEIQFTWTLVTSLAYVYGWSHLALPLLKLVFATSDVEIHRYLYRWTVIKETTRSQCKHYAWTALNEECAECRLVLPTSERYTKRKAQIEIVSCTCFLVLMTEYSEDVLFDNHHVRNKPALEHLEDLK